MLRKSYLFAELAVLVGIAFAPRGLAQAPAPRPALLPPVAASTGEPDPLPGLPRPPDQPASLHAPAPPAPPYTCDPLPGPYFEYDPRLDPPDLPHPGWFADVDLGIVVPHVKNRLTDLVQVGMCPPDVVHLPSASLDWTVAPRFELGYRLPSGFGAFTLSYRFLTTEGRELVQGLDAPADLKSRVVLNIADVDYVSREFFTYQWPYVEMRWRFGIRVADAYFDSQATEPFDAAAAGSGIFYQSVSNSFVGVGPHAGVELSRRFKSSGLAVLAQLDGATLLGQLRQHFTEISTTLDANGVPMGGETRESNPQDVPILSVLAGVNWQPPAYPRVQVFVGYAYEYWWNLGRLSTTTSRGELSDQGLLLRAGVNW